MTIMDWWYTSQEFASISELEIGETITCSQLECSCTRVSSFELSMIQLPLPSADRALAHGLVAVRSHTKRLYQPLVR